MANIVPIPQGKYSPAVRHGDIVYTSGMTPRKNGVLILAEKVKTIEPIDRYKEALEQAAENVLNAVISVLTEKEQIVQLLNMTVFIAAEDDFTAHSKLADYASEYLYSKLGSIAIGSRAAIGVCSLPGGAPVEIQITALVGK